MKLYEWFRLRIIYTLFNVKILFFTSVTVTTCWRRILTYLTVRRFECIAIQYGKEWYKECGGLDVKISNKQPILRACPQGPDQLQKADQYKKKVIKSVWLYYFSLTTVTRCSEAKERIPLQRCVFRKFYFYHFSGTGTP